MLPCCFTYLVDVPTSPPPLLPRAPIRLHDHFSLNSTPISLLQSSKASSLAPSARGKLRNPTNRAVGASIPPAGLPSYKPPTNAPTRSSARPRLHDALLSTTQAIERTFLQKISPSRRAGARGGANTYKQTYLAKQHGGTAGRCKKPTLGSVRATERISDASNAFHLAVAAFSDGSAGTLRELYGL